MLATQKFAEVVMEFTLHVLMTKTYMCSAQLLASQQPWVGTWCLVYYQPFVAEEELAASADHMALETHACPTGPSVGCTQAGLLAGELLSLCFAWCLLLPEPATLHSFVSLPQGPQRACFCSKSPPEGLHPAGLSVLSAAQHSAVSLHVSKAKRTAEGTLPCEHTWA